MKIPKIAHLKPNKNSKYLILGLTLSASLILVLFFIVFTLVFLRHSSKFLYKPDIKTPNNVMKKIPPDVQKNLNLQPSPLVTYKIPILLYHYIEYVQDKRDTIRQSLNVNPNTFESQIKTLKDAGYTFMTAADFGNVLNGKSNLPQKPVILTIDDGHWDLATSVLPILQKYNVKATAYIVPGLLGGSDYLTQKQLQEVIDSKLVDIGAHTVHHISLKGRLASLVNFEVVQSKLMLEQTYNIHIVSFAYPNGSFDEQAIDIVKNAGFTTAASTIPGTEQNVQNRFFLYRIRPGYNTGKALISYINQTTFKTPFAATPSATKSPQKP